jgi:hypothetical protein
VALRCRSQEMGSLGLRSLGESQLSHSVFNQSKQRKGNQS